MSNPILNENFLKREKVYHAEPVVEERAAFNDNEINRYSGGSSFITEAMTVNGAINKTFILFGCLLLAAIYTWGLMADGFTDKALMLCIAGGVGAFVSGIMIHFLDGALFKIFAPMFAICEGLFIGGFSALFEAKYTGVVFDAVIATFAVLVSMLILYRINAIRVTEKFRSFVFISTLSVGVIYLIQIIASLFGRGIPLIFTSSSLGIGFSIFVVIIAALNFINDFDYIERGAQLQLEKDHEWYGAFGLMVTFVWLYLEMLRLLAKLNNRN